MFQKDKKQYNSSNSQSREISSKGKSVDSSLGGLSGSSKVVLGGASRDSTVFGAMEDCREPARDFHS